MTQLAADSMASPDDHRVAPRRRVMKSGRITFGDFKFSRECSVRDISDLGARISVTGPHEIPSEFFLVLSSERTLQRVEVRWRRGNELGVVFIGEPINIVGNPDARLRQFMF